MKSNKNVSNLYIFILISTVSAALLIILYPEESLNAAKSGILLWFNTVLPALFPFFVCSKVMTRLGIVKILGRLLEPILRPLFRVPGEASIIFAISITSGYPIGVQMVSELRQNKTITRDEAERMLSFCSTSGPLFILGSVGAGMFADPLLGWSIAISHFSGAILNGLAFRFHGRQNINHSNKRRKLIEILEEAEKNNKKSSLIVFIGEAIIESFRSLLLICGYIIFFSILISLLEKFSIFILISNLIHFVIPYANPDIFLSFIKGVFEITLGCHTLSQLESYDFVTACIICTGIISWSGLSIHAQSLTFIAQTDIRSSIYLITKIFHSIFSMLCASILAPFILSHEPAVYSVFYVSNTLINQGFAYKLLFSTKLMIAVIILFIVTAILNRLLSISKK